MNDTILALIVAGALVFVTCAATAIAYSRTSSLITLLRGIAWALLPVGLFMTGLLGLLIDIVRYVVSWVQATTMTILVWTGVSVLAIAVVLFIVAKFLPATKSSAGNPSADRRRRAITRDTGNASERSATPGAPSSEDAEIEAILKSHGIQ